MAKPKRGTRPQTPAGARSATMPARTPTTANGNGARTTGASSANTSSSPSSRNGAALASKPTTSTNGANGTASKTTSTTAGSASSSSRLAAIRERQPAPRALNQRRRFTQVPWWRRGNNPLYLAIAAILVVIVIFVSIAYNQSQASALGIGKPVTAQMYSQMEHVPASVFSKIGITGLSSNIQGLPPTTPPLKGANGLPEMFYVGGEFCPYCAALRWSMVISLSQFGAFKNLKLMRSATTDGNFATLTFNGSSYTSKYLAFTPVEVEDRNSKPLQQLTDAQNKIFTTYDAAPYTQQAQSFPFVYYGGKYVTVGLQQDYDVTLLQGLTWTDITNALTDASNSLTQAIIAEANYLTAAVCIMTNQQPGSVCKSATIQQVEKHLTVA
ncbi:MAG: DUF929 family protein [Ktedonobacterales bacterium]